MESLIFSNIVEDAANYTCREDFFRDESFYNSCVPICPTWKQTTASISTLTDVVYLLAFSVGFVVAIIIVVISVVRYKTM